MSVIVRKATTLRLGALLGSALALSLAATAVHRANADPARGALQVQKAKKGASVATLGGADYGFIQNKGQWDEQAKFFAGWHGLDVWVEGDGIKYDFYHLGEAKFFKEHKGLMKPRSRSGHVVGLKFVGANEHPATSGVGEREGVVNFLRAQNSVRNVPTFNEAWVTSLYHGINMRVYRDHGAPRFDLIVAPGADINQIKFNYQGANSVQLVKNDSIKLKTRFGEVAMTDLYAYQQIEGEEKQVGCKFIQNGDGSFGFQVSKADASKPVIIDPVVYSTLLGGYATTVPGDDIGYDVAVDQFNQPYVCGSTSATNFPITNGAYDNSVSNIDAYITKFKADGSNIIWSTVVGGSGVEEALAIAIDRAGRPIITGYTTSSDQPATGAFPTTPNAIQVQYAQGASDGFVVRLDSTGSALDYGTYVGAFAPPIPPPPGDFGFDVGVDRDDNVYVVGQTEGPNFPTTPLTLNPNYGGSTTDGFALKLTSAGNLDYSTFIGGSGGESVNGVAVDDIGNAFLVGATSSQDFPLVAGSFDTTVQGTDAFVAKLVPTGKTFDYSTVIGGSGGESGNDIALDNNGNAYICGSTGSVDFPRTAGCFDDVYSPPVENYVTKLAIDGRSLVYSTFMGGGGTQRAIGVDDLGVAHIVGYNNPTVEASIVVTTTGDFQAYNGPASPFSPGDAYLQAVDEAGTNLLYGSFLGGTQDDAGLGLYVDGSRNAYVVGITDGYDGDFPTTPGSFKPTMFNDNPPNGPAFWDTFLTKIKVRPTPLLQSVTIVPGSVAGSEESQMDIALTAPASPGGAVIRILSSNENIAKTVDAGGNLLDQIVIPEGQTTSGPIRITTVDVVSQFVVTFTVELEGDTKTVNLTVAPWLTNLTISPSSVVGGNRITGRVTLFRPAIAGMTIGVSTSDPSKAYAVDSAGTKINSFVVPTGNTTATFDVLTRGVDAKTNVTILVKVTTPNLQVTRSQTLQIVPASLRLVSFAPNRVNGNEKSTGTVLLDGEVGPTPVRVDLKQGSTGNPPVDVTFPNGQQTFAIWIIQDVNDVEKGKSGNFQVTAGVATANTFRNVIAERLNTNPVQTRQGTLFVDQTAIASLDLDSLSVVGGQWVKGHITLSQPAAPSGLRCKIRSDNVTYAPFGGTVTEIEVYVPPGAIRSNDFTITTKLHKGPADQIAHISTFKQGYPTITKTLTIRHIDMTFTATPNSVVGGSQNFDCTLTLNELAPTNGVSVNITSSNPAIVTVPSTIKIDEGTKVKTFAAVTRSVVSNNNITLTATVNTLPSPLVRTQTVSVRPLGITLALLPPTVTGGLNSTGKVTVGAPAGTTGLRITTSSSNPAVAVTPSSIVIPTGSTTGTFNIVTFQVGTDTNVTITAKTPAGVSATATLRVLAVRLQVTVNPNSVIGGIQNTVGTVASSTPAPGGGTKILLTSGNTSAATVPASATIAAGATSTQFVVTTKQVAADTTVSITAKSQTGSTATTTMVVRALTISLTLSPSVVDGGPGFSTGLITLGAAPNAGGMLVSLSSNSSAVNIPNSVTVGQGQTTKTFSIGTNPVIVDTNATITATLPSGRTAKAILKVLSPRVISLKLDRDSVIGGDSTMGTVVTNLVAPAAGLDINLSSGNGGIVQVPATVTIPAGEKFARFNVTTSVTPVDTNVTLTATYGASSQTATLQVLAPTLVSLTLQPNTLVGGASSTGTVRIDRLAPAGGLVITLDKDPGATGSPYVHLPASVTIPAGSSSATFTVTTNAVSRTVATQISATFAQRSQVATAVLTLQPQ